MERAVHVKFVSILLIVILLSTCSKSKNSPTPSATLAISSLSISSGSANSSLIINGTGFSATVADDKVFFNSKAAIVTAATTTQLVVIVPLGAGNGNITISVNNGALITGPLFTYQPSWVVSTIAGSGLTGKADGPAASASFNYPLGIAVDKNGNIYVADRGNLEIRKITADGVVSTFITQAGLGVGGVYQALVYKPYGIAVDAAGNVYVSEDTDCTIRKSDPNGVVTIFAGNENNAGTGANGVGTAASFFNPDGMTIDNSGNIYVAEYIGSMIRKITPNALVSTVAGSLLQSGTTDGTGASARFTNPTDVAIDPSGNLFVVDRGNHLIRKITPSGVVSTFAGNGSGGYTDGQGTAASFNSIVGLVADNDGNLYVTDLNVIRKIDPAGNVTTFAGQTGSYGSTDGPVASATFFNCQGIAIDAAGSLYVTEAGDNKIRKISMQ